MVNGRYTTTPKHKTTPFITPTFIILHPLAKTPSPPSSFSPATPNYPFVHLPTNIITVPSPEEHQHAVNPLLRPYSDDNHHPICTYHNPPSISATATSADPTSLKCAACGCHHNFHRREPEEPPLSTATHTHASPRLRFQHIKAPTPPQIHFSNSDAVRPSPKIASRFLFRHRNRPIQSLHHFR
ncbi:hypothetical protein KIW84_012733 [Lathyrus oleraceus]|uniref:ZF-HD dimerization-type domain-containing protein n=1 Tax=Pisum sativum TaxID=3888 RepID=A0A9D5BIC0_PEA|nr:hypothetical protein KIW84_012733 [Pisum sativum]